LAGATPASFVVAARISAGVCLSSGVRYILYCSATKCLTTPFIVYSSPDPSKQINNVWPETWVMPFRIHALGSPDRQFHKDQAAQLLPVFKAKNTTNISRVLALQATAAFVPSPVSSEDWQILIEQLAG
jgi:hypothetical protein